MVPAWIQRLELTHFAIDRLGLRRLANAALRRRPIVRKLPSGVRYRWRYLDSIPLADGIFGERTYDRGIPQGIKTFADLGCNVGYFIALLAEVTGRRDLRGIAIDADDKMIEEAQWIVDRNHLEGIVPVHGLVAGANDADVGKTREFFLHPVTIKSSLYAVDEPGQKDKGPWRKVSVPVVDVEALWVSKFGDVRCDLLKIDIEGAEAEFVTADNPFLRRVDAIVMEIHKWVVAVDVMEARLEKLGFERAAELQRTDHLLVATYRRRAPVRG